MTKIRIQTISNAISLVADSYFCIPSPPPLPSISFNIDAVLWLCQRGANVHALKNDGWDDTALHYAAARGDMPTAQVLLAYGADASPVNAYDATPAELARKRKHQRLADYLDACASGKTLAPLPQELEGWKPLERARSGAAPDKVDIESGSQTETSTKKPLTKEEDAAWRAAMAPAGRAWY